MFDLIIGPLFFPSLLSSGNWGCNDTCQKACFDGYLLFIRFNSKPCDPVSPYHRWEKGDEFDFPSSVSLSP